MAVELSEAEKLEEARASVLRVTKEINAATIDRDTEVRLGILALVSREHMLMLGPPGTAKTLVATYLGRTTESGKFFEILLSKFTTPDEVFGPVSVKELISKERHFRKTDGYLPWAETVMLDECFKGSSAILNTLLTAINERKFDNGGQRVAIPLGSIFGASNELPQDDVLAALYDRFLIRTEVQPVSNPLRLLDVDRLPKPKSKLLHLNTLRAAVPGVVLPTNVRQAAASIKSLAEAAGAKVGDRRFRLSANLIRASAAISGRTVASANDLWPLSYCYWTTPDQIPTITRATRTAMDQAGAQHEASETAPYEDPGPSPSAASGPSSGANTAYQGLVSALRADPSTRAKMLAATASAIRSSTPDAIKADAKLCVQIRALAETAPPANKKVRPNASDPDHLVKLMAGRI